MSFDNKLPQGVTPKYLPDGVLLGQSGWPSVLKYLTPFAGFVEVFCSYVWHLACNFAQSYMTLQIILYVLAKILKIQL